MASLGSLVVSLTASTAKFEAAMSRANHVMNSNMRSMTGSVRGLQSSIDGLPGSFVKVAASGAAITGLAMVFKKAMNAADEFKTTTIGIAAGLTNIAKPGQGDFGTLFKRNLVYAEEMAKKLEEVAAKTPAEPQEMMIAYNQLVQQGYGLRLQEAEALGVLVTKIKLATAGQDANRQINQEIRSLMQGQALEGAMLAKELETRLGPGWKEIVNQHKQAGDLMTYLASLWPGVVVAGEEYEKTLVAQGTTLVGNLKFLGREGFAGAYEDIVGMAKSLNDYLREHGKELAGTIQTAWSAIKEIAGGVVLVVSEIVGWFRTGLGYLSGWVSALNNVAKQRSDLGAGAGLDLMPGMGEGATNATKALTTAMEGQQAALAGIKAAERSGKELLRAQGPVAIQTPTGKGEKGGGGKGAEAAADRIRTIIDNLNKDIAKLSQGSIAEIDAWAAKTIADIEKVGRKGAETQEALSLVAQATALKKKKVEEDFQVFVGKESGNAYIEIEAQAQAWLTKYKGIKGAEESINDITARKKWETDVKVYTEILGLQRESYDNLASLTPIVSQQNTLKRKALDLEIEISKYTLEKKLNELQISDSMKDELRNLQALENQAKKYNQAMESDRGLKGWAYGRSKEANDKNTIKDLMTGAESFMNNAFSSGIQGVLSKDKNSLKDIGKTMFQGFLGEIHKGSITKAFDSLAKIMTPKPPGAIGGDTTRGLTGAANLLSEAGLQLGLSAGGLILSGIGIMTNSQALVVAGSVLQMAGLAIQLYEALAATTTMSEMSIAAGSLVGSATSLSFAATALTTAASALGAAGGGSVAGSVVGGIVKALPIVGRFFHSGGVVYAHAGWPRLAADEVPIIAQEGEGVLSRTGMSALDALNSGRVGRSQGDNAGGSTVVNIDGSTVINAIDARGVEAVLTKHRRHLVKLLNTELGRHGKAPLGKAFG